MLYDGGGAEFAHLNAAQVGSLGTRSPTRPSGPATVLTDLHVDIETASEVDLTEVGLDVYSKHPSTRILMVSWKLGAERGTWTAEEPHNVVKLTTFLRMLLDPTIRKWAHNAQFERTMFREVWDIDSPVEQWRCTMAWAFMLGLPGALAQLGDVLLLPAEMKKDRDGMRLMRLFSMPQKVTKKQPYRWRNHLTNPVEWAKFVQYNQQDVTAEAFIAEQRLNRYELPDSEWRQYYLDQKINQRGLPIDRTLVEHATKMVIDETHELMTALKELSGLENPNSDTQFGPWIRGLGFPYGDLKKATVARALDDPALSHLHEALTLRAQLKRTAVKKFFAVQASTGDDARLRYTYQFCGASRTGRWSGRGAHFQNPARPSKDLERYVPDILESVRANDVLWVRQMYGDPMKALSSCVRGMIRAPEGRKLVVADLASIEACVIAWLAGCESMLEVFRSGKDIYRVFATYMFHKPYDQIIKAERNLAKPPVLGCGFRLSGGEDMISPKTGDPIKTGLYGYAENMGITMTRDQAHYAVGVFREAYPEIVQFWYDIEAACMHVLQRGGEASAGRLRFDVTGPFMRMHLPSGRMLHYLRPKIEKRMMPWGKEKWSITFEGEEDLGDGRKRWGRQATHGGKLAENGTQAVANCVLREGLAAAEAEGFDVDGHSHDEAITEVDMDSALTAKRLCDALTKPLSWGTGLPLSAAGYEAITYRKD